MVDGVDRDRLNHAWNDLFGSWPYHDAYLGMLADHFELTLAEPPHRRPGRREDRRAAGRRTAIPHVAAGALRRGEQGDGARRARPPLGCARLRQPRLAPAAHGGRAGGPAGVLPASPARCNGLDHDDAVRAVLARVLVSPAFLYRLEPVARSAEQALDRWELASRLSFFLWSSIPDDELRRAAAAGELSNPTLLARAGQAHDRRSQGAPARHRVLRAVARLLSLRSATAGSTPAASRSSPTK